MRWRKNLSLWIHPQFRLSECTNPSFRACAVLTYKFPAIFCQNIDQRRSFEVSILAIDDFLSCFFLHPGIKRKILMDYDRSGPHGSPSSVLHDERNINIFPMLKFLADSLQVACKFVSHLYSGISSDRTSMKMNDLTSRFEGCFLSYLSTAKGQKLSSTIFNTRLSFEFFSCMELICRI